VDSDDAFKFSAVIWPVRPSASVQASPGFASIEEYDDFERDAHLFGDVIPQEWNFLRGPSTVS
jgi:hypothetical protein